jgi:hypothetical protein
MKFLREIDNMKDSNILSTFAAATYATELHKLLRCHLNGSLTAGAL